MCTSRRVASIPTPDRKTCTGASPRSTRHEVRPGAGGQRATAPGWCWGKGHPNSCVKTGARRSHAELWLWLSKGRCLKGNIRANIQLLVASSMLAWLLPELNIFYTWDLSFVNVWRENLFKSLRALGFCPHYVGGGFLPVWGGCGRGATSALRRGRNCHVQVFLQDRKIWTLHLRCFSPTAMQLSQRFGCSSSLLRPNYSLSL